MSHNSSDKWKMMKHSSFRDIHSNKLIELYPYIYKDNKLLLKKDLKQIINSTKLWTNWKDGIDYRNTIDSIYYHRENILNRTRMTEESLSNDIDARDDNELVPYYIIKNPLVLAGVYRLTDCYEFLFYYPGYNGKTNNRGIHINDDPVYNNSLLDRAIYYRYGFNDYVIYIKKYDDDTQSRLIESKQVRLTKEYEPYDNNTYGKIRDNYVDNYGFIHKKIFCEKSCTMQYSLDGNNWNSVYALNLIDGNDSKLIIENYKIPPPPTNENPDDGSDDSDDDDDYDNTPPDWLNGPGPHPGWGPYSPKPKKPKPEPAKPKSPNYYISSRSLSISEESDDDEPGGFNIVLYVDTTEFKHEPNEGPLDENKRPYSLKSLYGSSEFHIVEGIIVDKSGNEELSWWYGIHDKFYVESAGFLGFGNPDLDDYYRPVFVVKPNRKSIEVDGKTYNLSELFSWKTIERDLYRAVDRWTSGGNDYPFNYERIGCYNGYDTNSRIRHKCWDVWLEVDKSPYNYKRVVTSRKQLNDAGLPYSVIVRHGHLVLSNLLVNNTIHQDNNEDPSYEDYIRYYLFKKIYTMNNTHYLSGEDYLYEYGLSNKLVIKLPRTTRSNRPQLVSYIELSKYLKVFFDQGEVNILNVHGNKWYQYRIEGRHKFVIV